MVLFMLSQRCYVLDCAVAGKLIHLPAVVLLPENILSAGSMGLALLGLLLPTRLRKPS